MAIDDADIVGAEGMCTIEYVREQRPAGQWLQHFRQVGAHALALSRGQDDDAQSQWGSYMNDASG
jgi:hypothetical protein